MYVMIELCCDFTAGALQKLVDSLILVVTRSLRRELHIMTED